jgi:hypothetical protein
MSISQRRKGKNGELELCHLLTDSFGVVIKRNLSQSRDAGHDIDVPPFRIECKRRAKIHVYEWMKQVMRACPGGEHPEKVTPVLMIRADGERWLVVMDLFDWMAIAREEIAHGKPAGIPALLP